MKTRELAVVEKFKNLRKVEECKDEAFFHQVKGYLSVLGYRELPFVSFSFPGVAFWKWTSPLNKQVCTLGIIQSQEHDFNGLAQGLSEQQEHLSNLLALTGQKVEREVRIMVLDQRMLLRRTEQGGLALEELQLQNQEYRSKLYSSKNKKNESIFLHAYIERLINYQRQPDDHFSELARLESRAYDLGPVTRTVFQIVGRVLSKYPVSISTTEEWIRSRSKEEAGRTRRIDLIFRGHGMIVLLDWKFSDYDGYKLIEKEQRKNYDYVDLYQQKYGVEVVLLIAIVTSRRDVTQDKYSYFLEELTLDRIRRMQRRDKEPLDAGPRKRVQIQIGE